MWAKCKSYMRKQVVNYDNTFRPLRDVVEYLFIYLLEVFKNIRTNAAQLIIALTIITSFNDIIKYKIMLKK